MMTATEIINMAREAGFAVLDVDEPWNESLQLLERFAALVRAAALEEAAVVCEAVGQEANIAWRSAYRTLDQGIEHGADDCADTIRKLKETK